MALGNLLGNARASLLARPRIAGMGQAMQGRSARYIPSEVQTNRGENQSQLQSLLTPDSNPAASIAAKMREIAPQGIPLSSLVPNSSGISGVKPFDPNLALSSGQDERAYDYLKQRASSGKIVPGFEFDLEGKKVPVSSVLTIKESPANKEMEAGGYARASYIDDESIQQLIDDEEYGGIPYPLSRKDEHAILESYVDRDLSPFNKAYVAAHEMGHGLLQHTTNRGDDVLHRSLQESEADSVAHGVMNRLYPWNKRGIEHGANYGLYDQFSPLRFASVGQAEHLESPETQALVNRAVREIVPVPRKPFSQVLPNIWAVMGRPNAPGSISSAPRTPVSPLNKTPSGIPELGSDAPTGISTSATGNAGNPISRNVAPPSEEDYWMAVGRAAEEDRMGRYGY